jgi:uncharacterized protein (TIGR03437 family)
LRKYTAVFIVAALACLVNAQTFTNGQAARIGIGQLNFTFGASGAQQWLLGGASGLAYANNLLFVADSNVLGATPNNNRVLIFDTAQFPPPPGDVNQYKSPSLYCKVCGYNAINLLGEPNYTSQGPQAVSSQSVNVPTAVATDGHILAVADTNNNRILIWNSIPLSLNQAADIVLGSASFTTPGTPTATQTTLRGPQGLWIQNGRLFVADTQNYRILIWNSIPTSNNQPADLVLGQPNFSSGTQPACNPTQGNYTTSASQFCDPVSVTSDGTHLFVSDLGFNRVLIWNTLPTSTNQPADLVIGQPNMTQARSNNSAVCSNGAPLCAGTLSFPRFALSEGTRLFIADGGNSRVLIFNSIPTTNGASADGVLGQPDFRTNLVTTQSNATIASTAIDNTGSVDTIPTPTSLAWDGSNLYVADPFNRRVVAFTPSETSLPNNSIVNWASEVIRQEGVVTVNLVAGGSIKANDTVTITIGTVSPSTSKAYTYTVKSGDTLDTIAQGLVSTINANGGDPNALAIFAGPGTASVYLSSKQTNLPFDSISLSATTSNPANLATTTSGAYLTSGTAATGAAGMLVEINGTNLSDQPSGSPLVPPLTQTLPTDLGGAQVFIDGFPAPLLSVSATQIITQIPYLFANGTAPSGSTSPNTGTDSNSISVYVRTVHNNGSVTITNASPVYIAPANPGLFSTPSFAGQQRPWPAAGALHQAGNPTAVVSVDGTATAGNTATITINKRNYTYTVVSGDSLTSIEQGLINLINKAPDPQVKASAGGAFNRVVLTALQGGAAGNGIPVSASTSTSATVTLTPYSNATCCNVSPGSAITPSNPAVPNELITVNAAGLGLLANSIPVTTGQPYNGPQPNSVSNTVSATLGGTTAQVIGAGLPPGSIGVYQIQLIIPTSAPTNSATELYVAQNAYISNLVTLPIGPATTSPQVPTAPPNPMAGYIDVPGAQNGSFSGMANFAGWGVDKTAHISSVDVFADGLPYGTASYGASRPDVCAAFPSSPDCPNVGWTFALDTTKLADGAHTFQITANAADGHRYTTAASFTTANANSANATHVFIDTPGPLNQPYQGLAMFAGWAVNDNAAISGVTVSVDGTPLGNAAYGVSRPDVCIVFPGLSGCPNVGWSILVDTNKLSNGTHTLTMMATAANGDHAASATTFVVANWSSANPMNIYIDAPSAQSGTLSGTAAFGGWAVNNYSAISNVHIDIDGASYGNANYGVVRTDVCTAYPGKPGCPNVGWNVAIDTTALGDGDHTLAVTATTVAGQASTVTTTFTVANLTSSNPLKVYIDVPGSQSAGFSGTASFAGWAVDTSTHMSSVKILVDGVAYGTASYGGPAGNRPDVCAVLPSSPDCPFVGWKFALDTTLLSNSVHLLEVTGTSSSGKRGTALTTFTVANAAPNGPMRIFVDQPNGQSSPYQGLAVFAGWAINTTTPVTRVAISVDGVPEGNATTLPRPDVCTAFPTAQGCPNVGWTITLDTTQFGLGNHTLDVTAYAGAQHATVSAPFTVANWAMLDPMQIYIDAPTAKGGPYFGTVTFGGWAVNKNGPIGSVSVSIDGIPFTGASYGTSRPDVCAALPGYAGCPNVGWSFVLDTTLVANGNHTLAVTATSAAGQSSTVSQNFTIAN